MPTKLLDKEHSLTASEKRFLELLFRNGSLTQAQLSEMTGLTQQSSSRLISGLLDRRMLLEGEKVPSGKRGYPSTSMRLVPEHTYSLGASLMADAIGLTLVDFSGAIIEQRLAGLPAMTVERVTDWLGSNIEEITFGRVNEDTPLAGLGVGVSGSHISNAPIYNTPFELEEWAGKDIDALLSDALNLPVWSDNDGNVAATGEAMTGVGKWAKSFAYIYLSSGVGGGIVLDGNLWRGRNGNAGEFAGGLPPNIYPFPNLELLRHLVASDGVKFASVHDMIISFDPTWPAIDEWIARVRDSLSIIVSNTAAILDLDAIVLGGRIPTPLAERVIERLELYDQKRRGVDRPMARVVPSEATGNPTALGAAMLPLQQVFFS